MRELRMLGPEGDRRLGALVRERRGHAHVHDREIGPQRVDRLGQGDRIAHLRHDLVAVLGEDARDPLAEQHRVVRDHDAHGISPTTRVPPPAALATVSRPPCASSRSASPRRPEPPASAPPRPSSTTSTTSLPSCPHGADPDSRRVGVLDGVRERLAGEEVSGGLDLRRQPLLEGPLDPHVERRASRERLERPAQPLLREDGGMDAAGELAQLGDGHLQLLDRAGEDSLEVGIHAAPEAPLGRTELERERDETLLGAVVDVALDAAALLVAGRHDPPARLLHLDELRAHLGVQPSVLEREARGGGGRREELRLLVERRVVDDHGDSLAFAGDLRGRPLRAGRRERDLDSRPSPRRRCARAARRAARDSDPRGAARARSGSRRAACGRARPADRRRGRGPGASAGAPRGARSAAGSDPRPATSRGRTRSAGPGSRAWRRPPSAPAGRRCRRRARAARECGASEASRARAS